jgi:hypothetical protein
MTMLKHGTRLLVHGSPSMGGFPPVEAEPASIVKWNRRVNGPPREGWHIVRFDKDGGQLCMHESRFTVAADPMTEAEEAEAAAAAEEASLDYFNRYIAGDRR